MSFTIVDSCSGCGRCVAVCPTHAIVGRPDGQHRVDAAACVDCGACAIVCFDDSVRDERGERFAIQGLCGGAPKRAVVHREDCTGCGECVKSCPFGAILRVLIEGRTPFARVIDSRCTGCSICELECDKNAIEMVCVHPDESE